MSAASWFFTELPPSRHTIENEMRLAFWAAGYKQMWFTCTKEHSPIECAGKWRDQDFFVEFEPKKSLVLKMKQPDQEVLQAFERVLNHKALAAYKNGGGKVLVEWQVKDAEKRYQELQSSGAKELERLDQ
jgi:hypothetical protein